MSKQKKEKDNGQEIPIDFQVESKNLNYTIVLRENEIEMLKKMGLGCKNHTSWLMTLCHMDMAKNLYTYQICEVPVLLLLKAKRISRCINQNLKRWKRK